MLNEICIKNFVLIKETRIQFGKGLNIITGETGAGKSVIIGALNLILGERADVDLIRQGEEQAVIEAIFSFLPPRLIKYLTNDLGIELENSELILRRQLLKSGKSRCFANGIMIPLNILKNIGQALVDIHGQHQHQVLLHVKQHQQFLDNYGHLLKTKEVYRQKFYRYLEEQKRLEKLEKEWRESKEKQELREFQLREIKQAKLKEGE